MAQIGNLEVFLTANVAEFEKNVKVGQKLIRDLAQKFVESGKSIENFNANVVSGMMRSEKAMTSAKKPATELNAILKALGNTLAEQTTDVVKNTAVSKDLAISYLAEREAITQAINAKKAYTKVAKEQVTSITDTTTAMREHITTIVDFDKVQRQAEIDIKSFSSSMWLVTAGLTQFGRAMTQAFTVPLVAASAAATKAYVDWEKATISIQRAANLSTVSANNITDAFIKISQQLPLTVADLQKAAYAAAQAGVTGEEAIVNFSKAAVMLSTVGGDALKNLPIEDLANQLAKLSIAFGETGDNWERVNNIASTLLVVAKAVPGGLGELIEGMRRASPFASQLGLSLADTTAVMGTLIAAAVPAARAGTEFGRSLLDMVQNADGVAHALGLVREEMGALLANTELTAGVFELADDETKSLTERLDTDLIGVLDELVQRYGLVTSNIDALTHVSEIFGKTSLKAILPLIQNYDLFKELQVRANGQMEEGTLIAAEFALQTNSLSGTLTVFANAVKSIAYAIGQDLAPYINWLAKNATAAMIRFVGVWKAIPIPVKFAIVAIGGLIAVLGPLALLINTAFLSPIAGMTTFISKAVQAQIALGAMAKTGAVTSIVNHGLSLSFASITKSLSSLIAGLSVTAIAMLKVMVVVVALAAAAYVLAKAFGFRINLPKMPKFNAPKYSTGVLTSGADLSGTGDLDLITEQEEKNAKAREKALKKELKLKRRARDKEIRSIEDSIKEYEKVRNAQIKAQEKLVDEVEEQLDAKKDLWEAEKDAEEEKIEIQNDILDSTKKLLKEQKKQLNALKKEQDAQVDVAKNAVDYAEMNLDEAQEWLKREKLLNHDEYDASYRAALEAVKFWEARVTLAKENLLAVQKVSQEAILAQEAIVDATEEQVDVQESAIADLKEALSDRTKIVEDEIELIRDELDVRKKALADIKDVTGDRLSLLREEKSDIQDAYDEEMDIMQERLDAASEALQDMQDMDLTALPNGIEALGANLEELDKKMREEIAKIGSGMDDDMGFGITVDPEGPVGQGKSLYKTMRENGYGVIVSYLGGITYGIEALGGDVDKALTDFIVDVGTFTDAAAKQVNALGRKVDKALVDSVFGEGTWDKLDQEATANGENLSNAFVKALIDNFKTNAKGWGDIVLDTLWGEGTKEELKKQSEEQGKSVPNLLWESFRFNMKSLWTDIKNLLIETFFGKDRWSELEKQAEESGDSIPTILWEGFLKSINTLYNKVKAKIQEKIIQPIKDKYGDIKQSGKDLINGLLSGIKEKWENIKTRANEIWETIKKPFAKAWDDAYEWGKNLISGLWDGMENTWKWVKREWDDIVDYVKENPVVEWLLGSPSKLFEQYGANLMKGLEIGISDSGSDALKSLDDVVQKISDIDLSTKMNIDPTISDTAGQITSMKDSQISMQSQLAMQTATPASTTINRNFYVQPGQMIATRGEVRNFVRMLREYDKFEEER